MRRSQIRFFLTSFILEVFWLSWAFAHAPVVERVDSTSNNPIVIDWPLDISIAIYGYFQTESDVDVVSFEVSDRQAINGVELYIHTLVPACNVFRGLLPTVAITGPEQKELPQKSDGRYFPFKSTHAQGVRLIENVEQGPTWYEPFSRKNYFWQNSITLYLSKPGQYRLYIWSPQQLIGDYVLALGNREHWGIREIMRAIRYMPKLLSDKEIHDNECREDLNTQTPSSNPIPLK